MKKRVRKAARKPAAKRARRTDIARPFNGGEWSEARMRSFAMSALRGARWPARFTVIERAFVRDGRNPRTGKLCKLHRCESCQQLFAKGDMKADHHEPVIPIVHDWQQRIGNFLGYDFNEVMRRLWIEADAGWNVLCVTCHDQKTTEEKAQRLAAKA